MVAIRAFEHLAFVVLGSTTLEDADAARALVQRCLDNLFSENPRFVDGNTLGYRETKIKDRTASDRPEHWLAHAVLSILLSASKGILPLARLRSLRLLQLYDSKQLARAFVLGKYGETGNGFMCLVPPRVPLAWCSPAERLSHHHRESWIKNSRMREVVIAQSVREIDWQRTTSVLVGRDAEHAIQILMVLLARSQDHESVFALLSRIPDLDRQTLGRVFGAKASFYLEIALREGVDTEILLGAGLSTPAFAEESELSREELLQQLLRERQMREFLEEQLGAVGLSMSQRLWEEKTREQARDPKGFYRILGIHPSVFADIDADAGDALVSSVYRLMAKQFHADKGVENEARMKDLNNARDALRTAELRRAYASSR